MADTVVVNGVTLTRAQVEQAMKQLDEPSFQPGDLVRWVGEAKSLGVVLPSTEGPLARLMNEAWETPFAGLVRVLAIAGDRSLYHTYTAPARRLVLYRKAQ